MHSPRIGLCLGREFLLLLHLLLVGEPCDGVLQVLYFLIKIILESIYFFVQGAFHIVYSLIQLHIDGLLLLYKLPTTLLRFRIACSTGDRDGGGGGCG